MSFSLLLKTYTKFYLKTKRFTVMLPLYILISMATPLLIAKGIVPKPADVYSFTTQTLGGVSDDVLLVAAVLVGDAISQDYSLQGYFTLTQPVSRLQLMLSRYISSFIGVCIIMVATFAVGIGFSYYLYGSVVGDIGEILALTILFAASLTMFVMMFSSLFRTQSLSIVVSILAVVVAMPLIEGVVVFLSHVEPWFLITYAASAISDLAMKSYPAHYTLAMLGTRKLYSYQPTVPEASLIMLGYLIVAGVIAYAVYVRRELKN